MFEGSLQSVVAHHNQFQDYRFDETEHDTQKGKDTWSGKRPSDPK